MGVEGLCQVRETWPCCLLCLSELQDNIPHGNGGNSMEVEKSRRYPLMIPALSTQDSFIIHPDLLLRRGKPSLLGLFSSGCVTGMKRSTMTFS